MAAVQIRPSLSLSRVSPNPKLLPTIRFVKIPVLTSRKLSVSMCMSESSTRASDFEATTTSKYSEDRKEQFVDESVKSYNGGEKPVNGKIPMYAAVVEVKDSQPKRYAKIHDFCLGIPFGGIIFGGGIFGFLFSRNPASLTTGVLLGGAILGMGVISLKVWRQGTSSVPLILGQAALAATLIWKHLQVYSLTKKMFPSGFYIAMSAAMICFYSYVLISGGNPPPKKKIVAASPS